MTYTTPRHTHIFRNLIDHILKIPFKEEEGLIMLLFAWDVTCLIIPEKTMKVVVNFDQSSTLDVTYQLYSLHGLHENSFDIPLQNRRSCANPLKLTRGTAKLCHK